MKWLLIVIATVVACEILRFLPFQNKFTEIKMFAAKAKRTITNDKISDHWKERVLPKFALRTGLACAVTLGFLILTVSPFLLVSYAYPGGAIQLTKALMNPWVMVGLLVLSILYLKFRSTLSASKSDYSPTDRFLHHVALGVPVLPEVLHDVERALYLKSSPPAKNGDHVFVAGLARAGTTILTRELHSTGHFGSLTYRDMPFVLAPNMWQNLAGTSKLEAKTRAHGDGIQVDLDSAEALEEAFWRITCGNKYILEDGLVPHNPDKDELEGYSDFLGLVLRRTGKQRYLSKNNNNILRIPALYKQFPNARFLIPVRAPFQHANSLLTQHQRFRNTSGFEANYFKWLVHHEFGANHRPFGFGGSNSWPDDNINYWLNAWIDAYKHLRAVQADAVDRVHFVSHHQLCSNQTYQEDICRKLGITGAQFTEIRVIPEKPVENVDAKLAAAATEIYAEIA